MQRFLFTLSITFLLMLSVLRLSAGEVCQKDQPKRCLVLDMDNKTLINHADVAFSDGHIVHTDEHGYFVLPDTFCYVIIAKNGYIRQKIDRTELGDTLFLTNASHCLPELTVVGTNIPKDINNRFRINATDMKLIAQGQLMNRGFGLPIGLLIYQIVKLL
ncbi:MAG: hypothetical protein ACOCNY_02665 [Prevotella sp.]